MCLHQIIMKILRCLAGCLQPGISSLRNRLVLLLRRSTVSSGTSAEVDRHCHVKIILIIISRLSEDDEFFSQAARRLGSEGLTEDVMANIESALFTAAEAYNFISDLQS